MKLDAEPITHWTTESIAQVRLLMRAGLGMSFTIAALTPTGINGFGDRQTRCPPAQIQDKIESGKVCTSCNRWRPTAEYHITNPRVTGLRAIASRA